MVIKYIDLFAGIGGIRLAFERACSQFNISHECVLSSEIDKKAMETYQLNFNEWPSGNIYEITDIPEFDFLLAGFPCQPFSYAGKQQGFGDTRGTLFFEIERILKKYKPKGFLLENVRGLVSHDKGRTFKTIINILESIGYGVEFRLLNSSSFDIPQNRTRVYIVGLLGTIPKLTIADNMGASDTHKYKNKNQLQYSLFDDKRVLVKDILEKNPSPKYFCSDKFITYLKKVVGNNFSKLNGIRLIDYRGGNAIHSWEIGLKGKCSLEEIRFMNLLISNRRKKHFGTHQDGKRLTLDQIRTFYNEPNLESLIQSLVIKGYLSEKDNTYNPVCGNMSFEVFKFLDPDSISITIVASDAHRLGVVQDNSPRRITPRECARLQGFPDSFALNPNDLFAYKQIGNSVAVPVVQAVLEDLFKSNMSFFGMHN